MPGGKRIHVTQGVDSPAREAWYRVVQLYHVPMHGARFAGPRWSSVEAGLLEQRARQLDEQRRDFMRGVLQLLLWQQQQQGHPAALLPEEVFFQILLGACPDSTLRAQLEARFAVVAEHLQLADAYAQRSTALAALAADASEPDEEQLQQLSEGYDGAEKVLAGLRRRGGGAAASARSHGKAVRAVEAFISAARGVLYGGEEEEEEEEEEEGFDEHCTSVRGSWTGNHAGGPYKVRPFSHGQPE